LLLFSKACLLQDFFRFFAPSFGFVLLFPPLVKKLVPFAYLLIFPPFGPFRPFLSPDGRPDGHSSPRIYYGDAVSRAILKFSKNWTRFARNTALPFFDFFCTSVPSFPLFLPLSPGSKRKGAFAAFPLMVFFFLAHFLCSGTAVFLRHRRWSSVGGIFLHGRTDHTRPFIFHPADPTRGSHDRVRPSAEWCLYSTFFFRNRHLPTGSISLLFPCLSEV